MIRDSIPLQGLNKNEDTIYFLNSINNNMIIEEKNIMKLDKLDIVNNIKIKCNIKIKGWMSFYYKKKK